MITGCEVNLIITADTSMRWFTWTYQDGTVSGRLVIGAAYVRLTEEATTGLIAELERQAAGTVDAISIGSVIFDPENRTQRARLLQAIRQLETALAEVKP